MKWHMQVENTAECLAHGKGSISAKIITKEEPQKVKGCPAQGRPCCEQQAGLKLRSVSSDS